MKCEVDDCTYETSLRRLLVYHITRIHKAKEKKDVEKQEIKEKVESQTEEKGLKCPNENCLYKTTKEKYLKEHIKRRCALKTKSDIVKCVVEECKYEKSTKNHLDSHIERVHKANDVENQELKDKVEPQTEKCSNQGDKKVVIFKGSIRLYKTPKE